MSEIEKKFKNFNETFKAVEDNFKKHQVQIEKFTIDKN